MSKHLSRYEKERVLRPAGFDLPPYPTASAELPDLRSKGQQASDKSFLDAGAAWEDEIDRLYAEYLASRGAA